MEGNLPGCISLRGYLPGEVTFAREVTLASMGKIDSDGTVLIAGYCFKHNTKKTTSRKGKIYQDLKLDSYF